MTTNRNGPGDGPSGERGGGLAHVLRRRTIVALLALATAVALALAWWAWARHGGEDDLTAGPDGAAAAIDLPRAGDRAVVLSFPRWDGDGWVSEDRRIPSGGQPGEDLLAVARALCEGPQSGRAISALPRGTRALAAFMDPARGTAVLDFSRELVNGHPGGSAAEAATLASIMRTVAANFPQVAACTILVDGRPAATLGGHLDLAHPLAPRRWQ